MTLTLKIRRFNPEVSDEPWWDEFTIQVEPTDRLVDALHEVKWHHDGTLTLRRSCAHGICGSDAMLINGRNALACKVLVKDVAPKVTIEPIRGLPVLKDLIVDMEPFFDGLQGGAPLPGQRRGEPERSGSRSPEERAPVRRHDEVHPVRRVHDVVPDLLGRRGLRRAGGDRERPPIHLRLPGPGRPGTARDPLGEDRGLSLPHDLQLHRGMPSRHRGHEGDPGSEASHPVRPPLTTIEAAGTGPATLRGASITETARPGLTCPP